MPQQKTRNHATVACTNCRRKHQKCNVLFEQNKCTNCNDRNLPCILMPGNKRGPKSAAEVFIANSPSPNSFSASNSFSYPYNHITVTNASNYETIETFQNTQLLSNFSNEPIMPNNEPNISSFLTNNLNGSFYHVTPHPHINPYNEATETSQNCV
ncbi:32859_t:CDS:1, partial [Racocetra persica]